MMIKIFIRFTFLIIFFLGSPIWSKNSEITILYTNDFHSAFDPIPAYWLEGSPNLGGAAHLSTLINQLRAKEDTVFLFDSGDMFTGMLANLTEGEALMEMMMTMEYDALGIGNHEFDYGIEPFKRGINKVSFPVLGANIFYKDTERLFSRAYTILERNGLRLGVIGIIGLDARSVILPSYVEGLDFRDPIPYVRKAVKELKPLVDVIVVLTHQGKTGPMQSDAENRPEVQRDFDEDIKLAGSVDGIDVIVSGHAHRGIEVPFVHPKTGTLIVQTYGYGTRLGYLKLYFDGEKITKHKGELIKVWSDKFKPNPLVEKKISFYKEKVSHLIGEVVGNSETRLVRDYLAESSLGNFATDVIKEITNSEVAFTNAGGLRADLPEGPITKGNVLDAFPFHNTVVVTTLNGEQIKAILEQGLSMERGMIQVSGLRAIYDLKRPINSRVLSVEINGKPLELKKAYKVGTQSFLSQGGDLYKTFLKGKYKDRKVNLSEEIIDYLKLNKEIKKPKGGRLIPVQ
ncbi:MAG: bifunctional UDP-sugar hydrolase/5'-nucleotidase [Pseudomonadota bacterium]|nr:bifunctional UDP-sugar hydrolase/5'-nucleotidase [Pseudomonadota bacterium]